MLWSLRDESGAIKPLSTIEEVSEAYEEENGVGTAKNGSQWTGNVLRLGDLAGREIRTSADSSRGSSAFALEVFNSP